MTINKETVTQRIEFQSILQQHNSRSEIIHFLEDCKLKHCIIYEKDEVVSINALIACLKHIEKLESSKLAEQREHQLLGIQKALDLKKNGKGTYGRPQVKLPKDFEKIVRHHLEEGIPLNKYREKIGMKCSTFYKKVSEIK